MKKNLIQMAVLLFLTIVLLNVKEIYAQGKDDKKADLSSEKNKYSYAIGYNVGLSIKKERKQ